MRDRLYRSRDERVIFGVAGGIADWLDIDPSLVRIGFVLAFVMGGLGLLLYIVMALVVPEEPFDYSAPRPVNMGAEAATGGEEGGAGPAPAAPPPTWSDQRKARRAARQARRAERSGRGPVIFGAILVLIGAWLLLRRHLPFLQDDFLGPAILILIGVVLIVGAVGRSGDGPAAPSV
jgi:phage shock protein PspC (stress-responsive transcriptional regulator)